MLGFDIVTDIKMYLKLNLSYIYIYKCRSTTVFCKALIRELSSFGIIKYFELKFFTMSIGSFVKFIQMFYTFIKYRKH